MCSLLLRARKTGGHVLSILIEWPSPCSFPREDHPVVRRLRRQVANALVLYANYKNCHWQTFGPLFRNLHSLFDEFAKDVLETGDSFAERIRMIGQDVQHVQLRQMQEAAKAADESNDPGTVDLFRKSFKLTKNTNGFLRDVLKKKDGLLA